MNTLFVHFSTNSRRAAGQTRRPKELARLFFVH